MNKQDIFALSQQCGFSYMGIFSTEGLQTHPEVREMCKANRCGCYGKSWSCPEAIGPIRNIHQNYQWGILVQSCLSMKDELDLETISQCAIQQKKSFEKLMNLLKGKKEKFLPMGSGSCSICRICTYPSGPCRYPERMVISLEGYGYFVSEICQKAGLMYNYGKNTICFSSAILFKEECI